MEAEADIMNKSLKINKILLSVVMLLLLSGASSFGIGADQGSITLSSIPANEDIYTSSILSDILIIQTGESTAANILQPFLRVQGL